MAIKISNTTVIDDTRNLVNLGSAITVAQGGTGATTVSGARLALLPSVVGNETKVLAVNSGGTDVEWATPSSSGGVTIGKAYAMAILFG